MLRLWILTNMLSVEPHTKFETLAGEIYVLARIDSDSVRKAEAWFQTYD